MADADQTPTDFQVNKPKRLIIVEPILVMGALFGFPMMMISQLYILDRLRGEVVADHGWLNLTKPNFTFDLCEVNKSDPAVLFNDEVQARASYFSLLSSVAVTIPALFVSVFLGAYSDKVGRKYAILPPLIGGLVKTVSYVLVVLLDLPISCLLIGSFIDGLGGYFTTLLMGCFAYISDITTPEQRRFRITALEMSFIFAAFIGPLGTGVLIEKAGYLWSFVISLTGQVVVVLYVIFFVPETVQKDNSAKFFDSAHFKRLVKVFWVKDVVANRRFKLIVLLIAFIFYIIPGFESLTTIYLTNRPLCMDADMIGYYMAAYLGVSTILGLGIAWVLKYCLSDPGVAIVAGLAAVAKNVYFGLVQSVTFIFFTPVFGMFSFLFTPTIRTLMSKMVTASEQGAVFGAIACTEVLCTFLGTIIFNPIYAVTQEFLTGFVFIVMAIFCFMGCGVLMIYMIQVWCENRGRPYDLLVQSSDNPDATCSSAHSPLQGNAEEIAQNT